MASRSEPVLMLRTWKDAGGEEWIAVHPFHAAVAEWWLPKSGSVKDRIATMRRLMQEIGRGERRVPEPLIEYMLELDAEQRANGCPDENLENLAETLRGAH